MKRKLLFTAFMASLLVSSCGYKPKPFTARIHSDQLPAGYSADARQGWQDGCNTGYDVYGNTFSKAFYKFDRDTTKIGNKKYESAWYEGYSFCKNAYNTSLKNDEKDWGGIFTLQ